MKINGLKHLNSNWYDSIMIRNINKSEVKVDVKNILNVNTLKSDNSFFNSIKKLSDKEKITEIIKYFLRNNQIKCINNGEELDKYKGNFITVRGSRDLYLQLDKNTVDNKIINLIINKYIMDREIFLFNNNSIKNIDIILSNKESYYQVIKNEFLYKDEKIISIKLACNNDKLLNFEEKFFINFIKEKIKNIDEEIYFEQKNGLPQFIWNKGIESMKFSDYKGNYIKCNKFIIKLDDKLFFKIIDLVKEHNKNIKNIKKLQLSFDDYT